MIKYQSFNFNCIILGIFIFIVTSCGSKQVNFVNEYMQAYSDIQNKQIVFPTDISIINEKYLPEDFLKSGMKIVCTGQMGCSPCVLRLKEIEKYIKENRELFVKAKIFYIASGEFNDYFNYQVKENNFSFPILHDVNATFIKKNGLSNYDKEVFLLDENNKIIFVGSPFNNDRLHEYYKKIINK